MARHKQTEVYNPIYKSMIEVDVGISELLELLWSLDIETINSCQRNKSGIMWISFPSLDAERFLTIIASNREEEMEDPSRSIYCRIMRKGWGGDWKYAVSLNDFAEKDEDNTVYEGESEIALEVSIRFPISDYDEILEKIRNYAASMDESSGNS